MIRATINLCIIAAVVTASSLFIFYKNTQPDWNATEIKLLNTLSIDNLTTKYANIGNKFAVDESAAALGHELFFDPRMSANQQIACSTCHQPEKYFTDGLQLANGKSEGDKNTMTIVGAAYSPWQFWDGRKDSLWSQALEPLENSSEHAGSRNYYAHIIYRNPGYRLQYEQIFGLIPDISDANRFPLHAGPVKNAAWNAAWEAMAKADQQIINQIFSNIGKAIAAYEQQLDHGVSKFDQYIRNIKRNTKPKKKILAEEEVHGLKLFIGKAQCISCHNGPLFSNQEFHNTGVPAINNQFASYGRARSVWLAIVDSFNCESAYSDANKTCPELKYTKKAGHELIGAHKVPSLRGTAMTAPYMHAGQFATLQDVVKHYNEAPPAAIGESEIQPLGLSYKEQAALVAFLKTLSAPINADRKWITAPNSFVVTAAPAD